MLLLIDYGTASAKMLFLETGGACIFREIPVGFPAYTQMNVWESLLYVLTAFQDVSGKKVFEKGKALCPIYLAGEIASVKLQTLLAGEVEDPAKILTNLAVPCVSVGANLAVVGNRSCRGEVDSEAVSRWLPFKTMKTEVDNYLANGRLFPSIVPATPRDLELEQSVAQEKIRMCLGGALYQEEEVYVTGAFLGKTPRAALAFLTLLNSLSPAKPLKVFLDRRGILPLLAHLKKVSPDEFFPLWEKEKEKIVSAGTAVWAADSETLKIEVAGVAESQEIVISPNSLMVYPLAAGRTARVSFPGKKEITAAGGEVGLLIDSRPRPLSLPEFGRERREMLRRWDKDLNVHGEIGDLWSA